MGNDPKNESAAHVNFFIPATQQKFQNIKEEFEFAISMTSLTQDPIVIIFLVNVKGGAILSLYIYIYMYVCMYVCCFPKKSGEWGREWRLYLHACFPSF
jgi:hypothetical protein